MAKSESDIIEWIVGEISHTLSINESDININEPFFNLGLSSLDVVNIATDLEDWLDCEVDETLFFEYSTIKSLATYLSQQESESIDEASYPLEKEDSVDEAIAIIGMSCHFPSSPNLSSFWDLLIQRKSAIKKIEKNHFERPLDFSSYAGLLNFNFCFDRSVFKISKEEEKHMDPQQKHLLCLSWQAMEDAGYSFHDLEGSKTGVFIGISTSDFVLEKVLKKNSGNVFDGTGFAHSIAANRISYFFNLKGPSIALDTACSSSLVALHQAIKSLKHNEADMALVGGVNLIMSPFLMESFHKASMLSPNGRCATFSKEADGYVRGEGGAVILIKPLSKALADGNEIYSIIKGSAVNQDGQTSSLTAPNLTSQVDVISDALNSSNLDVDDIQYIEAHGTGTPLGDPIEVEAIKRVFKKKSSKLYIGSVKTNIGHLEAAAGIASIVKASLAIKNKIIPSQINFSQLNPKINVSKYLVDIHGKDESLSFEKGKYIGVSSFGFGGTNSHVILGEAPKQDKRLQNQGPHTLETPVPIILSASQESSLLDSLKNLNKVNAPLNTISKELLYRYNSNLPYSFTVSVNSIDQFHSVLNKTLNHPEESKSITYHPKTSLTKIAFVFTGQGSEYNKLGLELYENFQEYQLEFDKILNIFQEQLGEVRLKDIWNSGDLKSETIYAQIILFTYQASYIKLLQSFNISGSFFMGHSFGEITAAYASGLLNLEDCITLILKRALIMSDASPGKMLVVYDCLENIKKYINIDDEKISLAVKSTRNINIISGNPSSINEVKEKLSQHKIRFKIINAHNGFHSYLFDHLKDKLQNSLGNIGHNNLDKGYISCFDGSAIKSKPDKYWSHHMRSTVDFYGAFEKLLTNKPSHIIEIGPNSTLLPLLKVIFKEHDIQNTSLLSVDIKDDSSSVKLYEILFSILTKKHSIDWAPCLKNHQRQFLKLPISQITTVSKVPNISNKNMITSKIETQQSHSINYKNLLLDMISQEVEIPIEDIKTDAPLVELGADSLVLLSCLESINEYFGVDISMADVFSDLSTIDHVVEFLEMTAPKPTIKTPKEYSSSTAQKELTENFSNHEINTIDGHSDIKELIKAQLSLMNQQLKALENMDKNKVSRPQASRPQHQKNNLNNEASGMGVLGNFQSRYQTNQEQTSDYLTQLINDFNELTPNSKAHAQKYRKPLADNRVSAGFRPNMKEAVYPIHFKKAKGAYFWDIDGNKYVDFTMGFGVNLFGHSPDFINHAVKRQLEEGVAVGPQSSLAGPVAEKLCQVTGMERTAFLNSGTEAVMMAVRLARAKTKRETVVIFEGSYHGHFDGILARKNRNGESIPVAAGVPEALTQEIIVLDYNSKESLNTIRKHGDSIAAVIIEGVQSRFPELRPKSFIKELRDITTQSGAALIVDEVINGFRVHPRGIQGELNFNADIAVYGKILGGGFPIGAVAGSKEFLDFIDGGDWSFGDNSFPQNEITFFAGTFCKHPLAMSASYEVLNVIEKSGLEITQNLNQLTESLAQELNSFFDKNEINLRVVYYGSLFRFKSNMNIDWLIYDLNRKGYYIWEGRNMFLSTAHTPEDIKEFIEAIKNSVLNFKNNNYKKSKESLSINSPAMNDDSKKLAMIIPQLRFATDENTDRFEKLSKQISLCIEFKGKVDIDALKKAIHSSSSRYDSLGAFYNKAEKSITFHSTRPINASLIDLSASKNARKDALLWLENNAQSELDPNENPVKIDIIMLDHEHFYISLLCHHLVADGLSIAFMTDDFSKSYNAIVNNQSINLSKLYHFSDYMKDYKARMANLNDSKLFWENYLKDVPSLIWKDKKKCYQGSRVHKLINEADYKKIRMFGYKNKSSLQNTLLSLFLDLMLESFHLDNVVVGLPAAGHTSIKETCVGQCVNIIPVKWNKNSRSLPEKINLLKEDLLENYKHRDYPLQKMEEYTGRSFIEILFNVEPITELPKFNQIESDLISVPISAAEYPIMINAMRLGNVLHIEMDYQEHYLSKKEAGQLLDQYIKRLLAL